MNLRMVRKAQYGREAGLSSDWHQLTYGKTKDRLGGSGLVRKGQSITDKTKAKQNSDFPFATMTTDLLNRTTASNLFTQTWQHNDMEKTYRYFGRSPDFDRQRNEYEQTKRS